MSDPIRIIKHEAVPGCGSFEIRFPDDRPSQFFYWPDEDDIPTRRLSPELLKGKPRGEGKGGNESRTRQVLKELAR
jgi:hypothetical protein